MTGGSKRQNIQKRIDNKKGKRKKQKLDWYKRNAANINYHRRNKIQDYSQTDNALRKRYIRQTQAEAKKRRTEYQRKWRSKRKNKVSDIEIASFPNRMKKLRALKKMKSSLPKTPTKRAATIAAYFENHKSPVVQSVRKKLISNNDSREDMVLLEAVMCDIKENLKLKKKKRSHEARIEMNSITTTISGESVSKSRCKVKLAKKLGVPVRTIAKGYIIRSQISHADESCFKYTTRKTRKDAISEELKRKIYDFWCAPDNSHPSGNKNDVKRVRTGFKSYTSHTVQVLRKKIYTKQP
ncbi:uncharacterized protein LOC132718670 [Ruditapes philippinarum]|uniref:uncharacterized protein LOC132718670 n=1 Tax=Ruditapes philippinarum TaxID=129788 RepID=UPI00295BFFF2|nr:uncharacterized protein LOC132718670 [Ruditapes philippinarum]